MGAAERDWHLRHGPIVRYFILPLGVEGLAVADIEALKDINLRHPYQFAKPQRAINWMKPVLGEKGILLVRCCSESNVRFVTDWIGIGQWRCSRPTTKGIGACLLHICHPKSGASLLGEGFTAPPSVEL